MLGFFFCCSRSDAETEKKISMIIATLFSFNESYVLKCLVQVEFWSRIRFFCLQLNM